MSSRASSSRVSVRRAPSPDDGLLDTDSEIDEFAQGYRSASGSGSDRDEQVAGNARWEPDVWDEAESSGDSEEEVSESDEDVRLRRLQNDLTSLPLSTLAKAQKALKRKKLSTPIEAREDRIAAAKARLAQIQKGKGKALGVRNTAVESGDDSDDAATTESSKRQNKHAPTAMSTKKQVSRTRQVVDVQKPDRRDPRFSSMSGGQVDVNLHSHSYSFLPEMLRDEFTQLKTAVAAATKAERNCPWAEKPARTADRERLEAQMGKLRTKIAQAERETREREALSQAKKEEKEKRAQGKGAWYMKKGEKRDLLLKARFDALEDRGGKTAVKKALEKKRRKIASKEKKSRPFARGSVA